MRTLVALAVVGTMLIAATPAPARAGAAVDAALALGAFAVFSQLLLLPALAQSAYGAPPPVVVHTPSPALYASAPATPPPAPAISREVVYPHGRHVLLGDGVTSAYRWVWVPNPPPGAPPAPPR
jgi:hypothetical protein